MGRETQDESRAQDAHRSDECYCAFSALPGLAGMAKKMPLETTDCSGSALESAVCHERPERVFRQFVLLLATKFFRSKWSGI